MAIDSLNRSFTLPA